MSLLTALIVKNSHINVPYLSKRASYTKFEKLLIPNLDLSENIGKVVIK